MNPIQSDESTVSARPFHVLLAEDDEIQLALTRRAIERARQEVTLHHVEDGQQCIDFLNKVGEYTNAPRPDLIFMDLNMPVMDGRQALRAIARDKDLRAIPVIVLTTSTRDDDIASMYNLRCSAYLAKPVDQREYHHAIDVTLDFWCNVVTLPRTQNEPGRKALPT